jgi:GxxExxY protein
MENRDPLTEAIIGAALKVRHHVGVGLLESAYHAFLVHELAKLGFGVASRPLLPVSYDGIEIKVGYRPDLIVNNLVIVELKTVTTILPVHKAQLLTYMRLSRIKTGLIVNFFAAPFSEGLVRMVL